MGFFDIDYNEKAWQSLAVRLRRDVQYAWIKVTISPVVYLAGLFKTFRDKNIYELGINGQVCFLEKVLNDTFDKLPRRIYIDEPDYKDALVLYRRSELKPVYVSRRSEIGSTAYPSPRYLYRRSELYTGAGLQFIVKVPAAITLDANTLAHMKAVIDKYRLVSKKNYSIVNF